ncbi:MAG: plasmid mobilization relaxosome protein MobC [Campylobacter sp.]
MDDEKYAKLLKQIEIQNEIIAEFLLKLAHIGTNINQIAYHLNINIYENNIENKMEQYLREIKKL